MLPERTVRQFPAPAVTRSPDVVERSGPIEDLIAFLRLIPRSVDIKLNLSIACDSHAVREAGRLLGDRLEARRAGSVEITGWR